MPTVSIHATNLINPNHMEWTNDGQLLVSEYSAGRIADVTKGGDMSGVKPFAYGLSGPASILPLPSGEILVAENWAGKVTDISKGGDTSKVSAYACGRSNPYSLMRTEKGSLYVAEHNNGHRGWVTDITKPNEPSIYIDNIPAKPASLGDIDRDDLQRHTSAGRAIIWLGGNNAGRFLSAGSAGQILNISQSGGDFHDLVKNKRTVAWNLGSLGGFKEHPKNGRLYITEPELGDVIAIDPKKTNDMRFQAPVIRGFNYPTCVRFSPDGSAMYVCSQGDGVVWKVTEFD